MKNYINENIRKYRKLKGFTQEELACELGVTSQAVSRWEAGNGMPDISYIVPLAQNLGVTTDMLFGMSDAVYDKEKLDEIKTNVDKMKQTDNSGEGLVKVCEYIKMEIENDPTCYELFDGIELSGGQWQRVALARGLYRDSRFIILDEPTSAIDPIEEGVLYRRFQKMIQDKMGVIVTHRLGSTKIADRILVLKEGKIVEEGNHEELMNLCGYYQKMYHEQAKWYGVS